MCPRGRAAPWLAGVGALLVLASGCGSEPERPQTSEVEVIAVEYEFRNVPAELPSGPTTFVIRNRGAEGHDFILTEVLQEDVRIPEVVELPQPERERFLGPVAETVIVTPGDVVRLPITLRPGGYAYLCLTTTEAGRTHAYEGMWGTFSVA